MIAQIAGTIVIGYIYDLVGRRITILTANLLGGLLVLLIPFFAPNVFPRVYIIRGLYAGVCYVGLSSSPLINDYIQKDSRGKANALQSFGGMLGELINIIVVLNLVKGFSLGAQC